jgi:hypothetical protein
MRVTCTTSTIVDTQPCATIPSVPPSHSADACFAGCCRRLNFPQSLVRYLRRSQERQPSDGASSCHRRPGLHSYARQEFSRSFRDVQWQHSSALVCSKWPPCRLQISSCVKSRPQCEKCFVRRPPLHAHFENADVIAVLLSMFNPLLYFSLNTPLHWSSREGHLDVCKFLIASDCDVDAGDRSYDARPCMSILKMQA